MHQVRDWFSGAAAYFGWMRGAKRENTRCGLRPMSDKAASQKTRSREGCDENGPAAALLLSHVSIQICSFVLPVRLGPPCRRPILIATPLNQSRTWCTRTGFRDGCLPHASGRDPVTSWRSISIRRTGRRTPAHTSRPAASATCQPPWSGRVRATAATSGCSSKRPFQRVWHASWVRIF